jgi:hypothetical protein
MRIFSESVSPGKADEMASDADAIGILAVSFEGTIVDGADAPAEFPQFALVRYPLPIIFPLF